MRLIKTIEFIGWGSVTSQPHSDISVTSACILPEGDFNQDASHDQNESARLVRTAAENAIAVAEQMGCGFKRERVNLVISASSEPDGVNHAAVLRDELMIPDAEAVDVPVSSCSETRALIDATRALQIGHEMYALVAIGKPITNGQTAGIGYGAVVVRAMVGGNKRLGMLNFQSRPAADGSAAMRGLRLYFVGNCLANFLVETDLAMRGDGQVLLKEARTFLLPLMGDLRTAHEIAEAVGIPTRQVLTQAVDGSDSTVLGTLAHYANKGHFKPCDNIVMATLDGREYNFVAYRWPNNLS